MAEFDVRPIFDDADFAGMIAAPAEGARLADWLAPRRAGIEARLAETPALLLRGFAVPDEAAFAEARAAFIPKPADYLYRSTPRHAVAEGVMTATEYPAASEILLHQENAYQRDWPLRLMFCCLRPADQGGATPIADMRRVTARIGPEIVDAFETRGVRYVRNYQPGFDLDWRTVFQTDTADGVAAFCRANAIEHEWLPDGRLRTTQICQGAARHPEMGERLWFNQAHLFHPSALGEEMMADLTDIFGPDGLPRDARFGDGAPIEAATLDGIRAAYAAEAREFDWQAGDVLLVDNMRVAHGRRPFAGERRVLVAMGRMRSEIVADAA